MKLKKEVKYGFAFIVLVALYICFIFINNLTQIKGHKPTINAPSTVLEVSVKDKESALLEGITAQDDEDGSLTDEIFIESISAFDDNQQRTVTYAVFDSDDHLLRTTRQIKYTDYTAPVINIKKALYTYYYLGTSEGYKDYVSASSSVDGDISSVVTVDKVYIKDDISYIDYSVTDSCGTKSTLTLKGDILSKTPNIEITLKNYLKRVKVGTTITEIAPLSNIKDIELMGMKNNTLKSAVEITNDYNPNEPGMYEFVYRISKSNGDYGITKLVVIVEE